MAAPIPKAFWPATIAAGVNDTLYVWLSAVLDAYATLSPGVCFHAEAYTGDDSRSLQELLDGALRAAFPARAWNTSFDAQGRMSVVSDGPFTLGVAGPANPLRAILGLGPTDNVAAAIGGGTYRVVAPYQHQHGWYADDPAQDDTRDLPTYNRAQGVALGGQALGLDFGTRYKRQITLGFLGAHKVFKAEEGASHLNEAIEHLFDDGWTRFRWWPDASDLATWSEYVLDLDTAKELPRSRLSPRNGLYSLTLKMLKYVAP